MGAVKTMFPKPAWSAREWELYTATYPKQEGDRAAAKLNTALWRSLRTMERGLYALSGRGTKKDIDRAVRAAFEAHIEPALMAHRNLGAMDSEPRGHAAQAMSDGARKVLGENVTFYHLW
jgi:hypothetical protein